MSTYTYPELSHNGMGSNVGYTGMSWTGFRPSDDACMYHYLIPANMFTVVSLRQVAEMLTNIFNDIILAEKTNQLADEIDYGIHKYGIAEDNKTIIYAYEVDGFGNKYLIDDANVPSLLSIDYLGYKSKYDPNGEIATNTRKFILSRKNKYYFKGYSAEGIGSAHTPPNNYWPMSKIIEGLTTNNEQDLQRIFKMLVTTNGNLIRESIDVSDSNFFTRKWFGWASSLFASLVIQKLEVLKKMNSSDFINKELPKSKPKSAVKTTFLDGFK